MRFSIRDLLLVTVIVALAVGWWVHSSQLAQEIFRLEMRERLRYPDHTPEGLRSPTAPVQDIPPKEPVD